MNEEKNKHKRTHTHTQIKRNSSIYWPTTHRTIYHYSAVSLLLYALELSRALVSPLPFAELVDCVSFALNSLPFYINYWPIDLIHTHVFVNMVISIYFALHLGAPFTRIRITWCRTCVSVRVFWGKKVFILLWAYLFEVWRFVPPQTIMKERSNHFQIMQLIYLNDYCTTCNEVRQMWNNIPLKFPVSWNIIFYSLHRSGQTASFFNWIMRSTHLLAKPPIKDLDTAVVKNTLTTIRIDQEVHSSHPPCYAPQHHAYTKETNENVNK